MPYIVTKRLDFCYGHRLLDYDGVCRHLHGHNAMVEVDIQADALDPRGMVVDFSDVKRLVKAWVDRELDHKMILRRDDPLVTLLQAQGEPLFLIDGNPTAERLAQLIYEQARSLGFNVVSVRFWETPTSAATYAP
jgi:6-pyruvoyltetrahydropterin/6-carboxytetrahydropterin synthase